MRLLSGLLIIFGVILLSVAVMITLEYSKAIPINFDANTINQLNNAWDNTPKGSEFIGAIDFNGTISNYNFLAYKAGRLVYNITDSKILNSEINATIHSHPFIRLCIPSELDKTSPEDTICIMCGKNKIRCYNT